MLPVSSEEFRSGLDAAMVKKRLRAELKYSPEIISDWDTHDFLAVFTKTGREGVLVFEGRYIPFSYIPSKNTNVSKPVLCTICATWQRASSVATIRFSTPSGSVQHLVCEELLCSSHVRALTAEGVFARAQMREDITSEGRVDRLKKRLNAMIETLS